MMTIYFAGSIRGGRNDRDVYMKLITHLKKHGRVMTEHIGDEDLDETGEKDADDTWIFERDVAWIKESDVLIAEVSTPSLGVGYELGLAEAMGKKILCLYRNQSGKRLSAMVSGNKYMTCVTYDDIDEACAHIDRFFK
jgi:2'-deoxynucleoside 5'-phosphate N-hydrolase